MAKKPGKPKADIVKNNVAGSHSHAQTEPAHGRSGPIGPADLLVAARDGDIDGIRAALDAGVAVDATAGGMADSLN